jgi:PAS domain-containing protein
VIYKGHGPNDGIEVYQSRFAAGDISPRVTKRVQLWNSDEADLEISNSFVELGSRGKMLLSIFRDVSERQRAEVALRTSEQEIRTLADAMPQIVWVTRADGSNIYLNQKWVDYTGLTREESYGQNWIKPFHPDDRQRAWDAWQRWRLPLVVDPRRAGAQCERGGCQMVRHLHRY